MKENICQKCKQPFQHGVSYLDRGVGFICEKCEDEIIESEVKDEEY
jgi:RNase P subunit RPR2